MPGEDHRHPGQPLHDPRQVVVDRREVDVERARDELAVVVELVGDPDQVVVDVAEVDDVLRRDDDEVAVRELVEDLAGRRGRPADREQLPLQDEEPLERPLGRRLDDLVLEVVDLVGERVEDREVAVDDPVGDRVEQEVGRPWRGSRRRRRGPRRASTKVAVRRRGRRAGSACRGRSRSRRAGPRRGTRGRTARRGPCRRRSRPSPARSAPGCRRRSADAAPGRGDGPHDVLARARSGRSRRGPRGRPASTASAVTSSVSRVPAGDQQTIRTGLASWAPWLRGRWWGVARRVHRAPAGHPP